MICFSFGGATGHLHGRNVHHPGVKGLGLSQDTFGLTGVIIGDSSADRQWEHQCTSNTLPFFPDVLMFCPPGQRCNQKACSANQTS